MYTFFIDPDVTGKYTTNNHNDDNKIIIMKIKNQIYVINIYLFYSMGKSLVRRVRSY